MRTGKLVWTFHTVPRPGEFGYDTWPKDAWKTVGGANVWGEMSIDEKRGIVYAPTASAKYNFYGADRTGANLFGDCLLALDARTGKRLWHFQMVHHDIWDYDDATAPKLLTVTRNGKRIDVVAQASKTGFVCVFDRVTGEPLWPIEERPVPRSDMPGEETWPTQPFPTAPPPFARQTFTEEDLNPFIEDPAERAHFIEDIRSARNEGMFTPPSIARDDSDARQQRRRELERRRHRSDARADVRRVEGFSGAAETRPASASGSAAVDTAGSRDHSLQEQLRFHDHEQRPLGHLAALDDDDGVRPE